MTRLFSVFWLVYCVLIPICYGWLASLRTLIIGAAIPLVPVALGCVFAASFVMFRVVVMLRPEHSGNLSELKEALYALAFALVASYFLFDARRRQWRSLPRAVV